MADRAAEKQASREEDFHAIASGQRSVEQVRRENGLLPVDGASYDASRFAMNDPIDSCWDELEVDPPGITITPGPSKDQRPVNARPPRWWSTMVFHVDII